MKWDRRKLWMELRAALRRASGGLLSGSLEAARWIERESIFSLEARTGGAVFLALGLLSLLQTSGSAPPPLGDPPSGGLAGTAAHLFGFAAAGVWGMFLGAVFRNAWNLAGAFFPRIRRSHAPRAARVAAAVLWTLLFHVSSLLWDMSVHPSLYQAAFYDHGGALARLQTLATDGAPAWLLALFRLAGWTVLALAAAEWFRRLATSFNRLPLPVRLGYAVLGGGLTLAGLGVWSVRRFQALRNQGPNLVVLTVPGLRADVLQHGASGLHLAPRMNELAGSARTYARCAAPIAAATPALATFWTGRTPLSHGIRHSFPSAEDVRLGPDALPALLRRQGYFTVALADAGGDFYSRLAREFDRVSAADGGAASRARSRALRRHCHLLPYLTGGLPHRLLRSLRGLPEFSDPALLAEEADRWLKRLRFRKRFALTVHFSSLQPPYAVSSQAALELLDPSYAGPSKYLLMASSEAAPAQARGDAARPEVDVVRGRQLYEANARAVDEAVGKVLDSLKQWHLDENTVVVLWSPFGQELGESPGPLRGWDVLSAPFAVAEPRRRTPPRWIEEPVRQQDAAPTLLDVLGLPVSEAMEGFPLKQRDFGEEPDEFFLVYSETDVAEVPPEGSPYCPPLEEMLEVDPMDRARRRVPPGWEDHVLIAKQRMAQLGPLRLVYVPTRDNVRFELYDFSDASGGTQDVARRRDMDEKLQDMKDVFFRFLARENGWRPQNGYWIPEAIIEP